MCMFGSIQLLISMIKLLGDWGVFVLMELCSCVHVSSQRATTHDAKGLTSLQQESQIYGLSHSAIYQWEKGKKTLPRSVFEESSTVRNECGLPYRPMSGCAETTTTTLVRKPWSCSRFGSMHVCHKVVLPLWMILSFLSYHVIVHYITLNYLTIFLYNHTPSSSW